MGTQTGPDAAPRPARRYTPQEVADLFRVDEKTVGRWDGEGKFTGLVEGVQVVIRTPGGHRRYHADTIDRLLSGDLAFPEQVHRG